MSAYWIVRIATACELYAKISDHWGWKNSLHNNRGLKFGGRWTINTDSHEVIRDVLTQSWSAVSLDAVYQLNFLIFDRVHLAVTSKQPSLQLRAFNFSCTRVHRWYCNTLVKIGPHLEITDLIRSMRLDDTFSAPNVFRKASQDHAVTLWSLSLWGLSWHWMISWLGCFTPWNSTESWVQSCQLDILTVYPSTRGRSSSFAITQFFIKNFL